MKAKDILNNSAKKNMINWSEKDFKKSHPKLYKTIIEAINQALIIDSVVVPKGTLCRNCGSENTYNCFLTNVKVCNKCHYQDQA